ncbi:MAG: hypothetical protein GY812_17685, partial [Actinomycetia bacterium]|nr:hypothetical protein [Actinomycetes bacterium]
MGLRNAQENARVRVRPGEYVESLTVATPGVELVSEARHQARITGEVTLTGDHARLVGFHIQGLHRGDHWVEVRCLLGCGVSGNRMSDLLCAGDCAGIRVAGGGASVAIEDNELDQLTGRLTVGVQVSNGSDHIIVRNQVTNISSGAGRDAYGILAGGAGLTIAGNTLQTLTGTGAGAAVGIKLSGVFDAVVVDNDIEEVTGGPGPGVSGRGVGIQLGSVSRAEVLRNEVTRVAGGVGGADGDMGGSATGVWVDASTGVELADNVLSLV